MFFQSKKKSLWKRLWRSRISLSDNHHPFTTSYPPQELNLDQLYFGTRGDENHLINLNDTMSTESTTYIRQTIQNGDENLYYDENSITSSQSSTSINPFGNCCASSPSSPTASLDYGCQDEMNHRVFRNLVEKLKDRQLETLYQIVEMSHKGIEGNIPECQQSVPNDCVLIPKDLILGAEPHFIACRLWRWPNLKSAKELKRIPSCQDPVYACCNPMHWSRLCQSETPPPPYCLSTMERLNEDDGPEGGLRGVGLSYRQHFPGSLTTDGEETSSGWCQLAYWELTQRVGRLFPVENAAVNVFSEQINGNGLCLTTLAQQRRTRPPDTVLRARQKIGLGVTLSRESDGIWLYNRSTAPVFVHSPTLNDIESKLMVYRVPPGHCLRAFDPNRAATASIACLSIAGAQTGPIDTHSVRISFAKGWGPRYSRQEVTACPCWLEVLLSPCR